MVGPFTPRFFKKINVKSYAILDDGRQAAVAELRRADELEDEVAESVTSSGGGLAECVTI